MQLDKKKLDLISSSIDTLYQDKSFLDMPLPERLKRITDVLESTSEHKDVVETWNPEDRKDSPHHHTNRLD